MVVTKKILVPIALVIAMMTSTFMMSKRNSLFTANETIEDEFIQSERRILWEGVVKKQISQTNSRYRRVPDVIGIGVKKCGTGALVLFLDQHPQVKLPVRPETFFLNTYYHRGLKYYERIMPPASIDELVMEKTPSYFFSEKVIKRIKKDLPHSKLILSLCNPIDRAFSDFVHARYNGHKTDNKSYFPDTFDKIISSQLSELSGNEMDIAKQAEKLCRKNSQFCILSKGIYQYNLRMWLENFNKTQLLIINGDNWITNPGLLFEQLQEFLGLPKLILQRDFIKSPANGFFCLNRWWKDIFRNQGPEKGEVIRGPENEELYCLSSGKGRTRNGVRSMLPRTYEKLRKFYEPHNMLLYKMLNRSMDW